MLLGNSWGFLDNKWGLKLIFYKSDNIILIYYNNLRKKLWKVEKINFNGVVNRI